MTNLIYTLYKTIEDQGYNVISIDHRSPILRGIDGLAASPHDVKKSLTFTNQKNSDILYIKYEVKEENISVELVYKKVKSVYQGPKKGHITLDNGLRDPDECKRYMSQHIHYLEKLSNKRGFVEDFDTLIRLQKEQEEKKGILTATDNEAYINSFNEILLKLSLEYKIPCTLAYSMPDDLDYLNLYLLIGQAIKENPEIINTDVIFPKEKVFNTNATRDYFKTFIQTIFPKDMQKEYLDNYKKLIDDK